MPGRFARSVRWTTEQAAFLIVAAGVLVGLIYLLISPARWKGGTAILGASAVLAAVLRGVLPARRAGMLVARSRWVDTIAFLALGVAVLAVDIRLRG